MCDPYVNIENIGRQFNTKNQYYDTSNPLSFIMTDNIDSAFLHGPNSFNYGPFSVNGQSFMKMYAAGYYDKKNTWDEMCMFYYNKYHHYDSAPIPTVNQATPNMKGYYFTLKHNQGKMSLGQMLVRNALEMKYIEYSGLINKTESFNPNIPNSPEIIIFSPQIPRNQNVKILINRENIDNCPLMNFVINYDSFMFKNALDILLLIYIAKQNSTIDITGTKLQNFFNRHQKYFEKLVPEFIHHMNN